MLLILASVIALPAVMGDRAKEAKVGVVGGPRPALDAALSAAAKPLDVRVELRAYPDVAAARDAVSHRKVDAVLASGRLLVPPDPSGNAVTIASVAVRALELPARAAKLGVRPAEARALLEPPFALSEVELASGRDDNSTLLALAEAVLLLLAISVYGQAVLMSVVQEKASRVVEVLLAVVRPRHLLAGKVGGIGALGLAQIALLAVGAAVAGTTGLVDLPSAGRTAPLALLWFLLGFVFYAVAFAAVGALFSRIEDASSASTPVTMTMLGAYFVSFAAVGSDPDGTAASIVTLLPVSAPFVIPSRVAVTSVPLWEHLVAVGLMLAAIWGLVRLGGRIYELGLLRIGPRVPFGEALRAALQR